MKTVHLLRHAKSSWKEEGLEDFDRPLGKRGRAAAVAIGAHLARESIVPDQILCSSARRTRETLDAIQAAAGAALPARFEKGLYLASAASLLRRLRRLNDTLSSVMLIGHNPGLEQLALALADAHGGDPELRRALATKFPTGGLAVIEADVARWADLLPSTGRLVAFTRPRDLTGG